MVTRPAQGAQFVMASWSFPDEYGQGIYRTQIQENSTGGFVALLNPDTGGGTYWYSSNSTLINLNYTTANTSLYFVVHIFLNYTLLGLSHPADNQIGRNYFRITLSMFLESVTIFSPQNLTYDTFLGQVEPSIWGYSYTGLTDPVLLGAGQIYTVVLTQDVFHVW